MWDIRGTGCCLRVVLDHHADVYDLCCHATRPFLLTSTSRDTTLRVWSCEMLVRTRTPTHTQAQTHIHTQTHTHTQPHTQTHTHTHTQVPGLHLALLEGLEATAQVDDTMAPGAPARLCSPGAMEAISRIDLFKTSAEKAAVRADLCVFADGMQELGAAFERARAETHTHTHTHTHTVEHVCLLP